MNHVVRALTVFEWDSEFHRSDQILVSADTWTQLDRAHNGTGPIIVMLSTEGHGEVVGRIRPAVPADGLPADACRVPTWMWLCLGAPIGSDDDCWCSLTVVPYLAQADTIVLRPRVAATLTESADPVAMLTAALTGAQGGLSWATLTVGAELPLSCGVFDVMEIRSLEGLSVPVASILDCDVNLELVAALDACETPPASPSIATTAAPAASTVLDDDWSSPMVPLAMPTRFPGQGRRCA